MSKVSKGLLTVVTTFVLTASLPAYAETATPTLKANPISAAAKADQKAHHASHATKVADLKSTFGFSTQKAELYATMDDKLTALSDSGQVIDLKNITPLTAQEITADPEGYQQRLLNLDPAAIKASLLSPVFTHGNEDIKKLVDQHKGLKNYVVQYPDGSSASMKFDTGTKENKQPVVTPKGYDEDIFGEDTKTDGDWYNADVDVSYDSGGLTAYDLSLFNLHYKLNNGTSSIVGFETGQKGYGTVTVANAGSQQPYGSSTSASDSYVEAENQVVFQTSGAISAGFDILSISLNAGASWTQYAEARIWTDDTFQAVAAQYD